MTVDEISGLVLKHAFAVHTELGPGLLESAYHDCLHYELINAGLRVESEKPLPLVYKGVKLECGYRVDLLVEGQFVVELKAVDEIAPIHLAQVLTYLKLMDLRHGLILNFNVKSLKQGIKRVVNGY
jgi:GxxExxY protein